MSKHKSQKVQHDHPHNHDERHAESHKHDNHHDHSKHHKMMVEDFKKRFIISIIVTLPILILSPLVQKFLGISINFIGSKYLLWVLSSFIFFYGGWPFLEGIYDELKDRQPGMMTLIALAISVAYIYSGAVVFGLSGKFFFWELATLIDIMLLGHWLEMKSVISASSALETLAKLLPDTAHLIKNNDIVDVDISNLKNGDTILIKPLEKIPADGKIVKGESYLDESMITGESKPIKKGVGDTVIGGSSNKDSVLEVVVTQSGDDLYLNKVINLVKEAQASKSKTQRLADTAARWLTSVAIFSGLSTFLYWFFYGPSLEFAIERMATVMIITCPHALGLAIPLVSAVSTSIAAKNGLLIRNRTAFESSKNITVLAFDKTGTLTKGNFSVTRIISLDENYKESDIVKLAASLEKTSEHPIAKGILEKFKALGLSETEIVSDFKILKGEGVEGKIKDNAVKLVSKRYVEKNGFDVGMQEELDVGSVVFLLINNKPVGVVVLADEIRKESFDAIKRLKRLGIKCWMITGDNEKVAKAVSDKLQLDGYYAQVLPHEKLDKIKEFKKRGEFIAMTGDGINDAPALAEADIGIAVGSGTDVAIDAADIILVNSSPKDVASLILLGRATFKKIVQNLLWATGYNVIAIPLAAGVLYSEGIIVSPAIGAALMSLSTVIVAINAKLLKVKNDA